MVAIERERERLELLAEIAEVAEVAFGSELGIGWSRMKLLKSVVTESHSGIEWCENQMELESDARHPELWKSRIWTSELLIQKWTRSEHQEWTLKVNVWTPEVTSSGWCMPKINLQSDLNNFADFAEFASWHAPIIDFNEQQSPGNHWPTAFIDMFVMNSSQCSLAE